MEYCFKRKNEEEQTTETYNHMDICQKNLMLSERSKTQEYMLYDFIYIDFKNRQNQSDRNQKVVV